MKKSWKKVARSTSPPTLMFLICPLFLLTLLCSHLEAAEITKKTKKKFPPTPLSGMVMMPTAYRGTGKLNKLGLGLDINAAYFIGRLYGKNDIHWTTAKTNYLDRLGLWLLTADGKMQIQTEGRIRPAIAAGLQGTYIFRDSPQPKLTGFTQTIQVTGKSTKHMEGAYIVASKKLGRRVITTAGFMEGNMGNIVALMSEFLTPEALLFSNPAGGANQQVKSNSTFFGGLLFLLRPNYPVGFEFIKPNGATAKPYLINIKLGRLLHLNFELCYLHFEGGWDLLGTFQFRYTYFPRRRTAH